MRCCLLIEDDTHSARYISAGLREMGYAVSTCQDGVGGIRRATDGAWDVIILDRILPDDVDGLSILTTLRGVGKRTPVLILSALSAIDERVRGLNAGCDDYLPKPFAFSELAARVEALVRRSRGGGEVVRELCVADLKVNLINRRVERAGKAIALQPREFRLLVYLMLNQRQVVTRTMLLEAVWDLRFDPRTNIIDVHISRLRNKIDKGSVMPLIHTVRGVGFMIGVDVPVDTPIE